MRRFLTLTLAAAALALPACNTGCKKACDHISQVCATDFASQGVSFDADHCTSACSDNLDGCKNMGEQEDCVTAAQSCAEVQKCPTCLQ